MNFFENCTSDVCTPPPSLAMDGGGLTIGPVNWFTTEVNLREMPENGKDELALVVNLDLSRDGKGIWDIVFDDNNADCLGTDIDVDRVGDGDEWVIEALATDVACLLKSVAGGEHEFRGEYSMPFKITVEKK